MSQDFFEDDERFAREVSRSLNANPRRASALQSIPQSSKAPILKGRITFRSSSAGLPITPVSLASTTAEPDRSGCETSSSSLSSLQSTDESSSQETSPLMLRLHTARCKLPEGRHVEVLANDTGLESRQGRKPRGLTHVLVSEADARSIPLPGPELLEKVERAKVTGEVPMLYESSVVRHIDGKWMVPQMCDSCRRKQMVPRQTTNWQKCDRGSPCSICKSADTNCLQGTYMTYVFGTKRLSQPRTFQNSRSSEENVTGFSLAAHIGQNQDGTWASTQQTQLCGQPSKKRKADGPLALATRNAGRSVNAASVKKLRVSDLVHDTGDTTDPKIEKSRTSGLSKAAAPRVRGQKRKYDDMDYEDSAPVAGHQGASIQEERSFNLTGVGPLKRKSTANKPVGIVKYHRSMQDDKPAPYGQPPVWADKRQNLCETLPYYRAYMSGAYMHDHTVNAFMVDKEVGPLDKFEEEIMISRVGGGRKLDEQSGLMIQKADQDRSVFALGFERAKETKSPVAIIAGQGNSISTSKFPHYYNVLDWFHVTDVWCEKSNGFKCWMVRLEKIRLHTKSWWASAKSPPLNPDRDIYAVKTGIASCRFCKSVSKEIYNAGWACLVTKCDAYFKFSTDIDVTRLDYNKEFMGERTKFTGGPLEPLAPPLPILTNDSTIPAKNFGYEKSWNTGIVCPTCNGCSRRVEWRQWTCETPGCGFIYSVPQKTMEVHQAIAQSFANDKEYHDEKAGIRYGQKVMGLYNVHEYVIPGEQPNEIAGIIRHFAANGIINRQPDGPNDLFRFMQESDFGLKRYPARQKGSTGEILTSHFAANWGAPYKYGVSVASRGFVEAPSVIIKALKRLTWAGEQTLAETIEPFHPFNELLSIGYFEDTAIGYHDDGEKELGPTVASLSLGSQAVMAFRPKAKCQIGAESKNAKGTKGNVLRMVLRHGDLVVMHGTGIQKLYEHAVTPQGTLRFALTCRYVRPELMANDEERTQAEIKGTLPDGHEEYSYDGDLGKVLIPVDGDTENVSAAQRAMNELSARALAGELNVQTLRECCEFLSGLMSGMGVPEGSAFSPPPSDTSMDDGQ